MGLLIGYSSNDFSLVPSAFSQVKKCLVLDPSVERIDWGFGYVQNDQALLRKNLDQVSEDFNFASLVDDPPELLDLIAAWWNPDQTIPAVDYNQNGIIDVIDVVNFINP